MRSRILLSKTILLIFCTLFLLSSNIIPAAENPNFAEVEKKLDEGGDLYFYMNLKDGFREFFGLIQDMAVRESTSPGIKRVFDSIDEILEKLGLYEIGDIGMSSLKVEDYYISRSFVRIPEMSSGLYPVFGTTPHEFHSLQYAPENASVYLTSDLDVIRLYRLIRGIVRESSPEKVQNFDRAIARFNKNIAAMGFPDIDLETLLNSLGDNVSVITDFHPEYKTSIPSKGKPLQIKTPRFALVFKTRDDKLFSVIYTLLQQSNMIINEESNEEYHSFGIRTPPNPFYPAFPAVGYHKNHLIVSTHSGLVKNMLDSAENGDGLIKNSEYREMTRDFPEKGNGMIYFSRHGIKDYVEIFNELAANQITGDRWEISLESGELASNIEMGLASVRISEADGILIVAKQSGIRPATNFASWAMAGGIIGAVMVPGFLRANQQSHLSSCRENLLKIDGAKEQWALEFNKARGAEVKLEELCGPDKYLYRTPVCPRGGEYIVGKIGEDPQCTCGAEMPR